MPLFIKGSSCFIFWMSKKLYFSVSRWSFESISRVPFEVILLTYVGAPPTELEPYWSSILSPCPVVVFRLRSRLLPPVTEASKVLRDGMKDLCLWV